MTLSRRVTGSRQPVTISWAPRGKVRWGARAQPRFEVLLCTPPCSPTCKARTRPSRIMCKCGWLCLKLRRQDLQQGGVWGMWLAAHRGAAERGHCWLEPTGRKSRETGSWGWWEAEDFQGRCRSPGHWAQREWVAWRGPEGQAGVLCFGQACVGAGVGEKHGLEEELLLLPLAAHGSRPQGGAAGAQGWAWRTQGALKCGPSVPTCAWGHGSPLWAAA